MKHLILFLIIISPLISFGQMADSTDYAEYLKAKELLQTNKVEEAYLKLKDLEAKISTFDTLYNYVLWSYVTTATHLQQEYRMKEEYTKSLDFAMNALKGIELGKPRFNDDFADRESFMIKNVIVANFGLGNFEEAAKWKVKLYEAKKNKELIDGIDEFFNFDFFTYEDKNIWGYEWYKELPEDRFSGSFSKVVYYVYSTNPDGSDKNQLYRLHVLMFHADNPTFDYVLTKRLETAKNEFSGTLYKFRYDEDIDFEKLHNDIKEVLKGNIAFDAASLNSKESDKTEKPEPANENKDVKEKKKKKKKTKRKNKN